MIVAASNDNDDDDSYVLPEALSDDNAEDSEDKTLSLLPGMSSKQVRSR